MVVTGRLHDEPRYTLDEARAVVGRERCQERRGCVVVVDLNGDDYVCARCGTTYAVVWPVAR